MNAWGYLVGAIIPGYIRYFRGFIVHMAKIVVVYHSGYGHTQRLAQVVAEELPEHAQVDWKGESREYQ